MELDDLKQTWKQSEKNTNTVNHNLMELIQQKSHGPISELKRAFRRQMVMIPILFSIVITNLSRNHQVFNSIMFWCFVAFCLGLCIFFYFNYRLVRNMGRMDTVTKSHIEGQVEVLEKRLKWHLVAIRIALIFFIILAELLFYVQPGRMVEKWHSVSPFIRLLAYAALLTFQYFVSRKVSQRKYGKYLAYLKELVNEMQ